MQRSHWITSARGTAALSWFGLVAVATGCGGSGSAPPFTGSGSATGSGAASGSTASGSSTGATVSTGAATSGSAASGASATGSSSGTPTTGVCAGLGTRTLSLANPQDAFIDDFEEAMILPGWSSFNDVMPQNSFKIVQVSAGAVGTAHAGHYAGTGAKLSTAGGFGVGTVFNTAIDPVAGTYCIDISAFDGVSFWAKAAAAGSRISLNFVLPQTNMATMDMMSRPNGGDCLTGCYNHPRVSVTLTADWAHYTVKFADATGGSAKVGGVIQELAWLSPDSNWDFSLDEIAFYKGTAPTGAIGAGDGGH